MLSCLILCLHRFTRRPVCASDIRVFISADDQLKPLRAHVSAANCQRTSIIGVASISSQNCVVYAIRRDTQALSSARSTSSAASTSNQRNAIAADTHALRAAFASFATGVTVITALDAHSVPVGLTANSFGSVSLDPPLVQWSLRINSGLHRAFVDASMFCVSVLSSDQEVIARQFSSRAPDRFADIHLVETHGEPPLIANALAHFVCRKVNDYRVGDHELFVGEVLRVKTFAREPLVFHASKFKHVL